MKKIYITIVVLMGITLSMCSCSKDESLSEEELFLTKLAHTWQVDDITLDGDVVIDLFPGMTLTFTKNKTFLTENPVGNIWYPAGTFSLQRGRDDLFNLQRNDDVLVTVEALDESSLVFAMTFATAPGGRLNGLVGQYIFKMKR